MSIDELKSKCDIFSVYIYTHTHMHTHIKCNIFSIRKEKYPVTHCKIGELEGHFAK